MIIAIAGMIGAWSFYQSNDSTMLRNGSRELLAAVQSARLPAGQLHYPCQLHINLDDQSYYLSIIEPDYSALLAEKTSDDDQDHTIKKGDILNLKLTARRQLKEGVAFGQVRYCPKNSTRQEVQNAGEVTLNFYTDGSADAAIIQIRRNTLIESVIISPCTLRAQLAIGAKEVLPVDIINLD